MLAGGPVTIAPQGRKGPGHSREVRTIATPTRRKPSEFGGTGDQWEGRDLTGDYPPHMKQRATYEVDPADAETQPRTGQYGEQVQP